MGSFWMWFLPLKPYKKDLNGYIYEINEDVNQRLIDEKQRKRHQFKLALSKDKLSIMKY
jgi:hypothetical protein